MIFKVKTRGGPIYSLTAEEDRQLDEILASYRRKIAGLDPADAMATEKEAMEAQGVFLHEAWNRHFAERTGGGKDLKAVLESAKEEVDAYLEDEKRTARSRGQTPEAYSAKWKEEISKELEDSIQPHLTALKGTEGEKKAREYIQEAYNRAFPPTNYMAPHVEKMQTPLDSVSSTIFRGIIAPGEMGWTVPEGKRKDSTRIDYYVQIGYEGTEWENVTMPNLNMFDRAVLDAIGSIYIAGMTSKDRYIGMSYEMIYKVMAGKLEQANHRIPAALIDPIKESLRKLSGFMRVARVEKKDSVGEEIAGPLLPYRSLTRYETISGKKIPKGGIVVYDMPLTFSLAMKNPKSMLISSRDATLLDVPGLNNTVENIMLRYSYFIRVTQMRNRFDRKISQQERHRTILDDYAYEDLGIEEPDDWKKKQIKKRVDLMLNWWAETGFIAGHHRKKERSSRGGRPADRGVVIDFEKALRGGDKSTGGTV